MGLWAFARRIHLHFLHHELSGLEASLRRWAIVNMGARKAKVCKLFGGNKPDILTQRTGAER